MAFWLKPQGTAQALECSCLIYFCSQTVVKIICLRRVSLNQASSDVVGIMYLGDLSFYISNTFNCFPGLEHGHCYS